MTSNLNDGTTTQHFPETIQQSSPSGIPNQSTSIDPIRSQQNSLKKSSRTKIFLFIGIIACFLSAGICIAISIQQKKLAELISINQAKDLEPTVKIQPTIFPTFFPNPSVTESARSDSSTTQLMNMVAAGSQMMGAFSYVGMYADGDFLKINNFPSAKSNAGCLEGNVVTSKYMEIEDYIKMSGIMDMAYTPSEPEDGLLCDGSSTLFIRHNGKEYSFRNPCTRSPSAADEKIEQLKHDIFSKLALILEENSGTSCAEGGYIHVNKSDYFCEKPQIKTFNGTSNLPSYLANTINNRKEYAFTG